MNGNCSSRCLIWTVNSWGKLLGEHHRINNKESQSRCDGDRHYHMFRGHGAHADGGGWGGGGVFGLHRFYRFRNVRVLHAWLGSIWPVC